MKIKYLGTILIKQNLSYQPSKIKIKFGAHDKEVGYLYRDYVTVSSDRQNPNSLL